MTESFTVPSILARYLECEPETRLTLTRGFDGAWHAGLLPRSGDRDALGLSLERWGATPQAAVAALSAAIFRRNRIRAHLAALGDVLRSGSRAGHD